MKISQLIDLTNHPFTKLISVLPILTYHDQVEHEKSVENAKTLSFFGQKLIQHYPLPYCLSWIRTIDLSIRI
jgi:hypothetical protein